MRVFAGELSRLTGLEIVEHVVNECASANRHPPLASAERQGSLTIGFAHHAQRRVPVAEQVR